MPDTNSSKLTTFMVAVKAMMEASVPSIGNVVILGQRDAESTIRLMGQKGGGQAVSIMPVGGNVPNTNIKGPNMTTKFQVSIYDNPNLRSSSAVHGYELCEQIFRLLHRTNNQGLLAQCQDTVVTDWFLEQDEGADVYTVSLDTTLKYNPLPAV
jgi:hypothetical protein|tara:strand:- start:1979 stop:2440 length:462 start_codon:yes stop_codon:yes gene_type:complete